jgi:DNA-binding HxlR family transcriptional regulator
MTRFRSGCPIASTLDIMGDKWTLVILRSMVMGARSYSDLLKQPEKIATNILADRLARMAEAGLIIEDRPRQGSIKGAYALTEKGAALLPVLQEVARWGETFLPDRWEAPRSFYELSLEQLRLQLHHR